MLKVVVVFHPRPPTSHFCLRRGPPQRSGPFPLGLVFRPRIAFFDGPGPGKRPTEAEHVEKPPPPNFEPRRRNNDDDDPRVYLDDYHVPDGFEALEAAGKDEDVKREHEKLAALEKERSTLQDLKARLRSKAEFEREAARRHNDKTWQQPWTRPTPEKCRRRHR